MGENRKIVDIVNEKTFQPGLPVRKVKPRLVVRRLVVRGGTWLG